MKRTGCRFISQFENRRWRREDNKMTDKIKLRKLSEKERHRFLFLGVAWTVTVLVGVVTVACLKPLGEYGVLVSIFFAILSAPLIAITWLGAPWWDSLSVAEQYQRTKHLRTTMGIQAGIGAVAIALTLGIPRQSETSLGLLIAMLFWTSTSNFYFVAFWQQIKMETQKYNPVPLQRVGPESADNNEDAT